LQFGKEDQWCGHKLLTTHLDRNTLPLSHLVGCRFFEMLPKTKKKKKGIKLEWNIFFIYTYIPAVDFQSWKLGFILLINNLKEWGDAISAFSILSIGILQSFLFWNIICLSTNLNTVWGFVSSLWSKTVSSHHWSVIFLFSWNGVLISTVWWQYFGRYMVQTLDTENMWLSLLSY
jgi:hypothetical protein